MDEQTGNEQKPLRTWLDAMELLAAAYGRGYVSDDWPCSRAVLDMDRRKARAAILGICRPLDLESFGRGLAASVAVRSRRYPYRGRQLAGDILHSVLLMATGKASVDTLTVAYNAAPALIAAIVPLPPLSHELFLFMLEARPHLLLEQLLIELRRGQPLRIHDMSELMTHLPGHWLTERPRERAWLSDDYRRRRAQLLREKKQR